MKSLRPFVIALAFTIGFLFPGLDSLRPMIPWGIRFMLLVLFLGIDFSGMKLCRSHFFLLMTNLGLAMISWWLLTVLGYPELGRMAFFVGISPTGTAAPVVTGFLGRKVEYVTTSLFVTTIGVALALIPLLPYVTGKIVPALFLDVFARVSSVIFVPMIIAFVLRFFCPRVKELPKYLKSAVFFCWVCVVAIILAGASKMIRENQQIGWKTILAVALISLIFCVINFVLGYWIGEKENRKECSQSLGQKNTSISIWLALTYSTPLAALGPTLYVLWHNGWNAIQMSLNERKRKNRSL